MTPATKLPSIAKRKRERSVPYFDPPDRRTAFYSPRSQTIGLATLPSDGSTVDDLIVLTALQERMDRIRETTAAMRSGELNLHHGCNRIDKLTREVAKEK